MYVWMDVCMSVLMIVVVVVDQHRYMISNVSLDEERAGNIAHHHHVLLLLLQVKDIMQEAQQGKLEPQPGQTMFSAFEFNVNTVRRRRMRTHHQLFIINW